MCGDNGDTFIATFHNVILAPDLCDRVFSIITLMNTGHTYLFHKGFCTVYFSNNEKNAVTLPHSAQRKHALLGKIKQISKSDQIEPKNKVALKLLHHGLEHRSTRSLMAVDTKVFWKDIELRIDPYPF